MLRFKNKLQMSNCVGLRLMIVTSYNETKTLLFTFWESAANFSHCSRKFCFVPDLSPESAQWTLE